jgi:hypothetical protein
MHGRAGVHYSIRSRRRNHHHLPVTRPIGNPKKETVMIDRYTKVALTVIAFALVAIAVQGAVPKASAFSGCGTSRLLPCYIEFVR